MHLEDYRGRVEAFIDSGAQRHTLGLVYGRRRIGKSTLLEAVTRERGGFYWEATRTESALQLQRLGEALGEFTGVGRIALDTWDSAFAQILRLAHDRSVPIVLDEFGHVLEADRSVDSVIASMMGPAAQRRNPGQSRIILCGSAIAMLRSLTMGEAPLRGRAGMELVMQPHDFRNAAGFLAQSADLALAAKVYAVIGGVIGYATDMVDHDLPRDANDFDRWISDRVLSPAATLHHEALTLLAEDPSLAGTNPVIHHGILGAIANGSVTAGTIANALRRSVSNLEPALKRLIDSGFVERHLDPIRSQRPTYTLSDSFLQFHYAVLEPHGTLLRDRNPQVVWNRRLSDTYDSQVRGPVAEEQARTWVRRFASTETLGGEADHVGQSAVVVDGKSRQLDVVVASGDPAQAAPAERKVTAIGEAKAGQTVGNEHLSKLERARASLGTRAATAKLLLFAPAFSDDLLSDAAKRHDVELVNLDRLYHGE